MSTRSRRSFLAAALLGTFGGLGACDRDVRLAGHTMRDLNTGTVEYYGVTLDQNASPEQVAYVLLRAIRDDALAETKQARDAAIDKLLDVSAAESLAGAGKTDADRREAVYRQVHHWTPVVSHYAGDFETEWEEAAARFVRRALSPGGDSNTATECAVFMTLQSPDEDPNAGVILVIRLTQEDGCWRVLNLGFTPDRRTLGIRPFGESQPAPN